MKARPAARHHVRFGFKSGHCHPGCEDVRSNLGNRHWSRQVEGVAPDAHNAGVASDLGDRQCAALGQRHPCPVGAGNEPLDDLCGRDALAFANLMEMIAEFAQVAWQRRRSAGIEYRSNGHSERGPPFRRISVQPRLACISQSQRHP
jgi:hypothetical protein